MNISRAGDSESEGSCRELTGGRRHRRVRIAPAIRAGTFCAPTRPTTHQRYGDRRPRGQGDVGVARNDSSPRMSGVPGLKPAGGGRQGGGRLVTAVIENRGD